MRAGRVVLVVFGVFVAVGCGGDDGGGGGIDLGIDDTAGPEDTGDTGSTDTLVFPGGEDLEFEEAPGQMRFVSLLSEGGEPVELDIYWGGPNAIETTEPVATIEYGVASGYLTPMVARDPLFPSDDISFTATIAGSDEVVFSWDRFLPDDISRLVILFRYEPAGDVNMSDLDENYPNNTEFEEPPAGQVAMNYQIFGAELAPVSNTGTSGGLGVQSGGRCYTVSGNVLDEEARQLPGNVLTINVDPGLELALGGTEIVLGPGESEPHWECTGPDLSDTVTLPDSGRAFVFATTGPSGEDELVVVPVDS